MSSSRFPRTLAVGLLLLAGVAYLADWALTLAIEQAEVFDAGRMAHLARGSDADEIPVFGSSKAASNYRPSVLGDHFYNYGMASTSLRVTLLQARWALRRPSRQPIIIDMAQWSMGDSAGDPRNYLLLASNPDVRRLMERGGIWKGYYAVPGLRYFGSWDWFIRGLLNDRLAPTKRMDRGYADVFAQANWDPSVFADQVRKRQASPLRLSIDEAGIRELVRLAQSVPQRKFVIVLSPLYSSPAVPINGEEAWRAELQKLLSGAPNIDLIDMTRVEYPETYYLDTVHLNQHGARRFSSDLRQALVARGIINAD